MREKTVWGTVCLKNSLVYQAQRAHIPDIYSLPQEAVSVRQLGGSPPPSLEFIPDTTPTAPLIQMPMRNQVAEVLLERIATHTR
jgi:hypothetical protein